MDNTTRQLILSYLADIRDRYSACKLRLDKLEGFSEKRLKITRDKYGREYYYIFEPEYKRFIYSGSAEKDEIRNIKEAHFLTHLANELEREIRIFERTLQQSRAVESHDIDMRLKKAYRGAQVSITGNTSEAAVKWKESMEHYKSTFEPFRPEELIHKTRDGTYVRSKSEALIYNYFLDIGVVFVYELPLRIDYYGKKTLLLPDFTILSEIDFKTVKYLEQQGLMNDPKYRNKFNDSVFKYWINGYIPERDVFFTFDLPNGGFDDSPVRNIIRTYIRPFNNN